MLLHGVVRVESDDATGGGTSQMNVEEDVPRADVENETGGIGQGERWVAYIQDIRHIITDL